ncbi:MAG: LPS export ABC transporter permease LptF [Pseudomonadota bacterium]|nr:LPS export ABC transporter permease LptF [Pseudomonadota bacterium]
MPQLDRYLLREFTQATFATLVVLLMVSLGGIFASVLGQIASGKVPASMLLSHLGLQTIRYMPMVLPLGLMLGLLLAVGRLYRDAEMPVLASIGVGPRRLLRPLLLLTLPVVAVIALCSLWLGPWAKATSTRMIAENNRNLLVAGLEPGRFTELPGGGVVYVGSMSTDGTRLGRIFVYRQSGDRLDVTTARTGVVQTEGEDRVLRLEEGFRVEGPREVGRDFRLMRYAANDLVLPETEPRRDDGEDPEAMDIPALLGDPRPEAIAQLHFRLAPPLLALAFALMAVPLARSSPRQARYGRIMLGFLAYLVGMNLAILGTEWLATGTLPMAVGLWWLLLPLLALGAFMYFGDGRMARPRLRVRKA